MECLVDDVCRGGWYSCVIRSTNLDFVNKCSFPLAPENRNHNLFAVRAVLSKPPQALRTSSHLYIYKQPHAVLPHGLLPQTTTPETTNTILNTIGRSLGYTPPYPPPNTHTPHRSISSTTVSPHGQFAGSRTEPPAWPLLLLSQ